MTKHDVALQRMQPGAPAVLSVLAAVCATLIGGTLGASPEGKLIGAALAAAIPPMISAAGSHRGLRVTAAIAVTAAAMLITYSGFTIFAYAAQQPSTFPLPPALPQPDAHNTVVHPPPPQPGIDVVPKQQLRCITLNCDQPVTIFSTGTARLKIGKIEIDGEHAADFRQLGQCENTQLEPGDKCAFELRFTPSARGKPRRARLVIYQNLPGLRSYLPLEGELPIPPPDLTISSDGLRCSYERAKTGGTGVLQVRFRLTLTNSDPDTFKQQVRVTTKSTSGLAADSRFIVSTPTYPTLSTANLAPKPAHFGHTHLIILTVDPGNEITENNETNNQTKISVTLPNDATASTPLPCHIEHG